MDISCNRFIDKVNNLHALKFGTFFQANFVWSDSGQLLLSRLSYKVLSWILISIKRGQSVEWIHWLAAVCGYCEVMSDTNFLYFALNRVLPDRLGNCLCIKIVLCSIKWGGGGRG